MNENVTYKALVYILLGSIAALFAFGQNASAKFEKVDRNETSIQKLEEEHKKDLKLTNAKFDNQNQTIKENQIAIIEAVGELKLLIEQNKPKTRSK